MSEILSGQGQKTKAGVIGEVVKSSKPKTEKAAEPKAEAEVKKESKK